MQKIGLGGGCHWCTEAVFASLKGVKKVEQGWINSTNHEASEFSEAIIVHFDPKLTDLDVLIEIHLLTHNSTSNHSMRKKYRSAIYTFDDKNIDLIKSILAKKQKLFKKPIVTKIYPFKSFKLNSEKFLDYYKKNKNNQFCNRYIEPKLKLLLEKYSDHTKDLM